LVCNYGTPIVDYLRRPEIRKALHIPDDVQTWDFCVDNYTKNYTKFIEGSFDVYKTLKNRYKVLKYSGDADGVVPTSGT
jgi:cathepsin A (carboxypeptidase C)